MNSSATAAAGLRRRRWDVPFPSRHEPVPGARGGCEAGKRQISRDVPDYGSGQAAVAPRQRPAAAHPGGRRRASGQAPRAPFSHGHGAFSPCLCCCDSQLVVAYGYGIGPQAPLQTQLGGGSHLVQTRRRRRPARITPSLQRRLASMWLAVAGGLGWVIKWQCMRSEPAGLGALAVPFKPCLGRLAAARGSSRMAKSRQTDRGDGRALPVARPSAPTLLCAGRTGSGRRAAAPPGRVALRRRASRRAGPGRSSPSCRP